MRLGTMVDKDFMILLPDEDSNSHHLHSLIACFSSGFEESPRFAYRSVPMCKERLQLSMERDGLSSQGQERVSVGLIYVFLPILDGTEVCYEVHLPRRLYCSSNL